MAYCTVAQVKAFMGGFADANTSDDSHLSDLINRVQAAINRYCHRVFEASANTVRTFDAIKDVGDGTWEDYGQVDTWKRAERRRTLNIDKDLCSINSITNGDGTTVSSSDYVTEPRNDTPYHAIVLKLNSNIAWTWDSSPENAISVSGKWAYSITAPDDVVQAAVRLTAWMYKQGENYDAGMDRPTVSADGVLRLPMMWPEDVKTLLAPLRRL